MKKIEDVLFKIPKNSELKEEEYTCALCHDTGYIFKDDVAIRCKCRAENDFALRQKRAGITPHLKKMDFGNFNYSFYSEAKRTENRTTYRDSARVIVDKSKEFCQDIIDEKEALGIVFMGSVGCGKTYLAAAIANRLIENKIDVEFVVVPDFLDELRSTFDYDSPATEIELMNRIKKVPVLILDDLGAHNYTEWSIKTLFAIINYRVNYELPMVVTTNLSAIEIEELIGARIYSRLVESCRFLHLRSGYDIRIKKRQQVNNPDKKTK
ncbi:MAG: ATP-binding protein [Clostridiales bacterium]